MCSFPRAVLIHRAFYCDFPFVFPRTLYFCFVCLFFVGGGGQRCLSLKSRRFQKHQQYVCSKTTSLVCFALTKAFGLYKYYVYACGCVCVFGCVWEGVLFFTNVHLRGWVARPF